jgi:single-strand DNA-binding protein
MSNTINVVGNLTKEPELRYTASGRAFCSVSIAASRRFQQNGEWQEVTSFFDGTLWGDAAENLAGSVNKGTRVVAVGRMEQREYTDKEGNKRRAYDFVIDEIGPSVRWARCQVERTTRTDASSTSQPASGAAPAGPAQYADEPPF